MSITVLTKMKNRTIVRYRRQLRFCPHRQNNIIAGNVNGVGVILMWINMAKVKYIGGV